MQEKVLDKLIDTMRDLLSWAVFGPGISCAAFVYSANLEVNFIIVGFPALIVWIFVTWQAIYYQSSAAKIDFRQSAYLGRILLLVSSIGVAVPALYSMNLQHNLTGGSPPDWCFLNFDIACVASNTSLYYPFVAALWMQTGIVIWSLYSQKMGKADPLIFPVLILISFVAIAATVAERPSIIDWEDMKDMSRSRMFMLRPLQMLIVGYAALFVWGILIVSWTASLIRSSKFRNGL